MGKKAKKGKKSSVTHLHSDIWWQQIYIRKPVLQSCPSERRMQFHLKLKILCIFMPFPGGKQHQKSFVKEDIELSFC